jgi:hypothetical protein
MFGGSAAKPGSTKFLLFVFAIAAQLFFPGVVPGQTKIARSGATVVTAASPKGMATVTMHTIQDPPNNQSCRDLWGLLVRGLGVY